MCPCGLHQVAASFLIPIVSNLFQDLYQATSYLRMHQLAKKLREHCLIGTSADASYEQSERMLACLIARCARYKTLSIITGDFSLHQKHLFRFLLTSGCMLLFSQDRGFRRGGASPICHQGLRHHDQGTGLPLQVAPRFPQAHLGQHDGHGFQHLPPLDCPRHATLRTALPAQLRRGDQVHPQGMQNATLQKDAHNSIC